MSEDNIYILNDFSAGYGKPHTVIVLARSARVARRVAAKRYGVVWLDAKKSKCQRVLPAEDGFVFSEVLTQD